MTDFEKVTDFGNMYRAFRRAKCGKGYKKSSARFNLAALDGVNTLIAQLKDKSYRVSDYAEFKVYEPKERVIQTSSFKDKVIQHCLCDNVIMPRLQQVLIHDNCAGQKGKGTLFGMDRLSQQMQQFHSKYGFDGYILKCDVTKFFYSISHEQLKDIVGYHFGYDLDICWLCDLFIDSTQGKGIPLGNQINQGFALLYLDGMDKMIQWELGVEYYGRYMDDFYLIHPSKEYLKHCLEVIRAYLETLDLTLNGKTQIFPFKNGVNYLGFHTYITADGKPIRRLKNQNKRNAQRKFIRMAKLVAAGELSMEKFQASYGAWKNHISHGNCYRLGRDMDEKINAILLGQEENANEKDYCSDEGIVVPCGARVCPERPCDERQDYHEQGEESRQGGLCTSKWSICDHGIQGRSGLCAVVLPTRRAGATGGAAKGELRHEDLSMQGAAGAALAGSWRQEAGSAAQLRDRRNGIHCSGRSR